MSGAVAFFLLPLVLVGLAGPVVAGAYLAVRLGRRRGT